MVVSILRALMGLCFLLAGIPFGIVAVGLARIGAWISPDMHSQVPFGEMPLDYERDDEDSE